MQHLDTAMRHAMQLMQSGDLQGATDVIQRRLRGAASAGTVASSDLPSTGGVTIEGQYRAIRDADAQPASARPAGPHHSQAGGTFSAHRFSCPHGAMEYKLFVPASLTARAPLIVMLHGCTQSPDDFARGTRMNSLAQEHGYVIAYPAQPQSSNPSKCWNWFRDGDQRRGRGEPALLAELTRHVVREHALDERRIYVAGLSAGGAMAAVLAATYPDLFAAIGVHSGLPFGAARDLPSALAAMRSGGASAPAVARVPAIVFHGDRDTTVDACNSEAVIEQFTKRSKIHEDDTDLLHSAIEHGSTPQGRRFTRAVYRDAEGAVIAEHWRVHGAGHAWFGGDPSGSYTDPSGPDASAHMLRFFGGVVRPAIN